MSCPNKITVNGVEYSKVAPSNGKRVVLVLDRGWIFAGDLDESTPGRLRLTRVVHVMSWQSGGFSGMCDDPDQCKAKLVPCLDLDAPSDCELFRVPVGDSWGL